MSERDRFFQERDGRSALLGARADALERPVGIYVSTDAAFCRSGQVAALALVNMAARVHRRIALDVADAPLIARSPLAGGSSLCDALLGAGLAICPFLEVLPAGAEVSTSIAIGSHPRGAGFYLGWMGATGMLDRDVLPAVGDDTRSILGAGMAACLGSAALFKSVHGLPQLPSGVSAWDLSMDAVITGPTGEQAIDGGSVAIVGAGAVGSAFAYWVNEVGHAGDWSVVDRDVAKLHNTNRCLTMTAADAGWPEAEGRSKVNLAAPLLAATPFLGWYDEWVAQATARPDLVLPLANEHGVRAEIGQRGEPLLVHATTSPAWWSQLHRHIAGRDDCIACRMPEAMPVFKCSSAPLPSTTVAREGDDAALPFVSAGAGLLLVSALLRLNDGFAAGERNLHWIDFRAARIHARSAIAACQEGCVSRLPLQVVKAVSSRSRWGALIP